MMLAPLIGMTKRVPYMVHMYDLYPEIMAACGLVREESIAYRVMRRVVRWSLVHARDIITIGRDQAKRVADARGTGTSDGIAYIPLWSDNEDVTPTAKADNPLLRELGLQDKFIVLHAGNMGLAQSIETIAGAVEGLADFPDIHFLFLGSGPKKRLLEELAARGAKNLTVLPQVPRAEQKIFLNAGDVSLLSLVPGMTGLAVPSRTFNLMAAGKPIIAIVSKESEVAQMIREHDIGWVTEPGNPAQAIAAIRSAFEGRESLRKMGERARVAAETRFPRERTFRSFDELVAGLQ
jgi:glycosyltransferase involved in cell wall biosynthesis